MGSLLQGLLFILVCHDLSEARDLELVLNQVEKSITKLIFSFLAYRFLDAMKALIIVYLHFLYLRFFECRYRRRFILWDFDAVLKVFKLLIQRGFTTDTEIDPAPIIRLIELVVPYDDCK